jgi:hypothetical protein
MPNPYMVQPRDVESSVMYLEFYLLMHVTIQKFPIIGTWQPGTLSTFTNMARILQIDLTHVGIPSTVGQIFN